MANPYTATYLVASLKRRGQIPSSVGSLDTDDFLALCSEEVQSYMMSLLLGVREEHAVAESDTTIVSGTASYDIPTRAIGNKLKNLLISSDSSTYYPLARVEPEHAYSYGTSGGMAQGYYIQGNKVVLVPSPTSSGTLRFQYFRRPNRVVSTDDVGEITGINTGTGVVTCSGGLPSTFTTSVTYDFVKGTPGFDFLDEDLTPTAATSTTLTFSSLPTGLAVGDFVCLAGESPIPQIPVELHPLLSQRVVVKVLEALGDTKGLQAAKAICDEMRTQALTLLTPRVEGAARHVINYNGPGWGRLRRRW